MNIPSFLRSYQKRVNNRGIAVIYVAIMLVALIAFVGLVIDIGYMYVAKTQLQNAADAAALGGAAELIEKSKSTNQPLAREAAWTTACNNKVVPGNTRVFLISSAGNCSSAPGDLNNNANDPNGDIILGHWDSTSGFTPGQILNNNTFINAVKVIARRTSTPPVANVRIGNNPVSLFFGKIFALLPGGGSGWPTMNVAAQAIAVRNNPPVVNLTFCTTDCGRTTSLNVNSPNITIGTRFYVKKDESPLIGWTTFFDNDTSMTNIDNYLTGNKTPPDLCNLPYPSCLYTTNGVVNPVLCSLKGMVNDNSSDYVVNGVTIHGMKVFIPVVDSSTNPCQHKGAGCVSDPTYQPGDAFPFKSYAEVIITDSVPQGNCPKVVGTLAGGIPGIVLVGVKSSVTGFSAIECVDCTNAGGVFIKTSKLVE